MRKTKILATLGPASNDVEMIKEMIRAGMNAARINFSHGTYESHGEIISKLKQAREELGAPIPLILDTKGPEIRIKTFAKDKIYIEQGANFILTTEDIEGDETKVSVTYKDLPKDLKKGSRILIDDGLIELIVIDLTETDVVCQAINSGFLSSRKGVNVPDVYVNLPSLTQKDIEDIEFGISQGFDFIAASFIRNPHDILQIREVIEKTGNSSVKIIAKIENRDGVNNLEGIIAVADGIMVARGDLGVEIPPEEVPLVQKNLIKMANLAGKPVITATQMLESMVNNPRPTRAEANDVANAIFDGTDLIMLSGETAKGEYPIESIKMMARIAETTENSIDYIKAMDTNHSTKKNITNAIAFAACSTAADINASCIITITNSGITPRMISRFRPYSTICAITKNEYAWRQLNMSWGCYPVLADLGSDEEAFATAVDLTTGYNLCKKGDYVVLAAGVPVGTAGTTNLLKVEIVGNILIKGEGFGTATVSGMSNVIRVNEQAEKYFKKGDILVTTFTNDALIPYIKNCSALIIGSDEPQDYSHAETLSKALDIPLVICNEKVINLIPNETNITVDSKNGYVYNGTC